MSPKGGEPLSVTRTVIEFVVRLLTVPGVHVNTPVVGLMTAPVGATAFNEYVNLLVGLSSSVADILNDSVDPTSFVWRPMDASTGGRLISLMKTLNV